MNHLITVDEAKTLGRIIGRHVDDDDILSYINETEQIDIKKALGDKLFMDVLENEGGKYDILLKGGSYTSKDNIVHTFVGLKIAMSYYVYGRFVKNAYIQADRFGAVIKDGEYSSQPSAKERSDCYNDAFQVAYTYLQECLNYINTMFPSGNCGDKKYIKSNRVIIRKIGE
nr:MAG TPA: hypothetical protein [Caudoviricetes sp.]